MFWTSPQQRRMEIGRRSGMLDQKTYRQFVGDTHGYCFVLQNNIPCLHECSPDLFWFAFHALSVVLYLLCELSTPCSHSKKLGCILIYLFITFNVYIAYYFLIRMYHAIWPKGQIMSLFLDICHVRNVYIFAYVIKCQRTDDFCKQIFFIWEIVYYVFNWFLMQIFNLFSLEIAMRMSFINEFFRFILAITMVLIFNVCKCTDLFITYVSIYYTVVHKILEYG